MYFHIGFPKAASSSLQKGLFAEHDDIENFGMYPTNNVGRGSDKGKVNIRYLNNKALRCFYDCIVKKKKNKYDHSYTKKIFENNILSKSKGRKSILFSHEGVLSVFFSYNEIRNKLDRIHDIYSKFKIILVVRNQKDIIKSQYRDWPFDPRNLTKGRPVTVDEWIKIAKRHDEKLKFISSLKYDDIINYIYTKFGKESVIVLCLEELTFDPAKFCLRISDFLEIDLNRTKRIIKNNERENLGVTRMRNNFRRLKRSIPIFSRISNYLGIDIAKTIIPSVDVGEKERYSLSSKTEDILIEEFSESNRNMSELVEFSPEKYNYVI